jgi:hypothetical protein
MELEHRSQHDNKTGIMGLVGGILRDATDIIAKEMTAARLEMREELEKIKSTALLMGLGAVALMVGSILLALTLVYLLQEFSGLDLWICYAIIGGAVSALGLIILYAGKRRGAGTSLVPTESIEKAKEDARWITRSVKYETR